MNVSDSDNDLSANKPSSIIVPSLQQKNSTADISPTVSSILKSADDATHTPPERDTGISTPPPNTVISNQSANHDSSSLDEFNRNDDSTVNTDPLSNHNLNKGTTTPAENINENTMNGRTITVPERTVIMPRQNSCPPPPIMTDVIMVGKQTETSANTAKTTMNEITASSSNVMSLTQQQPKKGSSMAFTIDFGEENTAKPAPSASTAFTVDMGDTEDKGKSLTNSDSLSNFLPQKLRKSFQGRASKVKIEKEAKEKVCVFLRVHYFFSLK